MIFLRLMLLLLEKLRMMRKMIFLRSTRLHQ
jgi:hypothetical protein